MGERLPTYVNNSGVVANVLQCFKNLHKTRCAVFKGDERALQAAREKINLEFKTNKNIDKPESVSELIKYCNEIEEVLKRTVIQTVQTSEDKFKANIRDEVTLMDTHPYNPMPDHMIGPFRKKRTKCSDQEQK